MSQTQRKIPVSLYTKCVDSCQAFSQYFMYTTLFEKGGMAFLAYPYPPLVYVGNIIYRVNGNGWRVFSLPPLAMTDQNLWGEPHDRAAPPSLVVARPVGAAHVMKCAMPRRHSDGQADAVRPAVV